jgi:hypothetical protein
VLLAIDSQAVAVLPPFPASADSVSKGSNHLLSASEGKENEETLESVERDERIPEALDIKVARNEAYGPREAHDKRQSDVEAKVTLRSAAGSEASCRRGREDHMCTRGEEGNVEEHHQSQR